MNMEEMETQHIKAAARAFVVDTLIECMLMTHPDPEHLLALIEARFAEQRASAALSMLAIGERDELPVIDALDRYWESWLSKARQCLRTN